MNKFKAWFDKYEARYPTAVMLGVLVFASAVSSVIYTAMWYAGAFNV